MEPRSCPRACEAPLAGIELEREFLNSVDDYLEFCEEHGEEPDRSFSGRLMPRLPPHVHRDAYVRAHQEGKSFNQWIAEKLEQAS